MKRLLLIPIALLLSFCASSNSDAPIPVRPVGHGSIAIEIIPNPILATRVNGETYDFPFEVVVRETGGRDVEIERVTADVRALGAIPVADESYDAEKIRSLGYATRIPANSEVRYRFTPRKEVPDDRLFSSVSAELRAIAHDDTGTPANASVTVTIRR